MSREIKFRAWDEQKKIMHYDFEFIRSGIEGNDWIVFKSDKQPLDSKPHPFENPYFSQQLKIMQFTGLFDKNNNDIYEGDALSAKYAGGNGQTYKNNVVWLESACAFSFANAPMWAWEDIEIIGNIYQNQNPELISK